MALIEALTTRKPQSDGKATAPVVRGADCLPDEARAKLRAIREKSEMLSQFKLSAYRRGQELRAEIHEVQKFRDELLTRYSYKNDHPQVVAENGKISRLEREFAEASKQLSERAGPAHEASELVRRLDDYIATLSSPLKSKAVPAALNKGESHGDAIARIRRAIDAARAKIGGEKAAPLPALDAKRIARAHMERLAALGAVDCTPTIDYGRVPVFPSLDVDSFKTIIDGSALLAWVFKDALIAKIDATIDAEADDEHALKDEERREIIIAAKSQILALEREEEAVIEAASHLGATISRRESADPRAVLMLADNAPEPKEGE